jgi:hypothetical protein
MLNLGLLYHAKANSLAQGKFTGSVTLCVGICETTQSPDVPNVPAGNLEEAKSFGLKAADFTDAAKPILEHLKSGGSVDDDIDRYINQLKPLRLQCHRIIGQIFAAEKDFAGCEAEFRRATKSFPQEIGAWQMLGRVLELQGKADEAREVSETVKAMLAASRL